MIREKSNNRGFTLVELIIAMSIFSIVIFMGYKVINGTNKATKEQIGIFNEQQAANLVNKYLTKDLELCKTINSLSDLELEQYRKKYTKSYGYEIIDSQNNRVDYVVGISDDCYDLLRIKDGVSLPIIENLSIKGENTIPFTIEAEKNLEGNTENRNLYTVNISNVDNKFEFKVNPRYVTTSDVDGGTSLSGEGHIIVHKTLRDKSVTINSTDEQGKYKEEIKVSKNNDGKTVGINIKDYKFKIVIDNYINGEVSGSININNLEKTFGPVDINRASYNFKHEGLDIIVRKEEYNDKDDDDDDDGLIIQIKKNGSTLVKLEKDDDEVDVELYNGEIDIEIDDDDEVDIEIGKSDSSKVSTYGDNNEIDIDIANKYIANIFGMCVKSSQTDIKSVVLNKVKYDNFDYIKFDPEVEDKIDLDINANNINENIVIVDFSSDNKNSELKPIGQSIRVEHSKNRGHNTFLKVSSNEKEIGRLELGNNTNHIEVKTSIKTSSDRKSIILKLVSGGKNGVYTITTDKEVKGIRLDNGSVIKLRANSWKELDSKSMNSGGGGGNSNNEFTLILLGD